MFYAKQSRGNMHFPPILMWQGSSPVKEGVFMLINLNQAFQRKQLCFPSFNFYNLESLQAILKAAVQSGQTVIAAFGQSSLFHMPVTAAAALAKTFTEDTASPFVLHLDHARNFSVIEQALEAGFSSVMYDGSRESYEKNIENTRKIVELAKKYNAGTEGELGALNPENGDVSESPAACYTDPGQAREFVRATGVDGLAVSVGNVHGFYKGKPKIQFDLIRRIRQAANVPLVLHGSSGLSEEMLRQAVSCGIRKININTDFAVYTARCMKDYLDCHEENVRMDKATEQVQLKMEYWILEKLQALNPVQLS